MQFSFDKKGLKGNFIKQHILPKWTDATQWRNAKQENTNIIEIVFRPIRTELGEPLSTDNNQWLQNVYCLLLTNVYHFGTLGKLTSIDCNLVWCCVQCLA